MRQAARLHPAMRNPFDSETALRHSSYAAFRGDALVRVHDPDVRLSLQAQFVHDSFRALVLNPQFSCVGAKSAVQRGHYRFGMYGEMSSPEATAGLARDLWSFVQEQPSFGSDYTTYIASFAGPVVADELAFEEQLWQQLQCLHDLDCRYHRWDQAVNADPDSADFSFSIAGRAFFVIGLHAASSRWARRFAWPTLVFNAHAQFERLKATGKFNRVQQVIRSRERALQGDINAMLYDFGERSEARQYSGRAVEENWRCPFHAHPDQPTDDSV